MSHIHIDVDNLSFGYDKDHEVLKNISFHAHEEDCIAIIGANGAGKSTLLKALVGLIRGSGEIRIEEIPLSNETLVKIREKVGYVFQDADSQLFMNTVGEDVAFAPRNYGLPEDEVQKRVDKALEMCRISHLKDRHIFRLSGGEKKLVSIATILSLTPDIILMDEPSVGLDPKNRRNLINILNSFDHLKIIATHDLDFVLDTCNRVILLSEGKVVYDGDAQTILNDKEMLEKHDLELPLRTLR